MPFIIGNEARPRVLRWETTAEADTVVAEHYGYQRLSQHVTHRRLVRFDKRRRFWIIEDELTGEGSHEFAFRFHVAPGVDAKVRPDGTVELYDKISGARLLVSCEKPGRKGEQLAEKGAEIKPVLETQFSSHDYGQKEPSVAACWTTTASAPIEMEFTLIPITSKDNEEERRAIVSEA